VGPEWIALYRRSRDGEEWEMGRWAEDLAVSVLRGAVAVSEGWPVDAGQRLAMAVWRQEPVAAVLVGRLLDKDEVAFQVIVCQRDGDEWVAQGGGGSSVTPAYISYPANGNVRWFSTQDVVFCQDDDEEAYVSTVVGVAKPDNRPVLRGAVRQSADEPLFPLD
jgi:hypothetical protein